MIGDTGATSYGGNTTGEVLSRGNWHCDRLVTSDEEDDVVSQTHLSISSLPSIPVQHNLLPTARITSPPLFRSPSGVLNENPAPSLLRDEYVDKLVAYSPEKRILDESEGVSPCGNMIRDWQSVSTNALSKVC